MQHNTTGILNTALGAGAGWNVHTASNVIAIGALGDDVDNSCYVANIWAQPGGPQAVYVNSDGKLGAQVSSQRFKNQIHAMESASEVIYNLKPVSFRYKPEVDATATMQFGLVAEDVREVNPNLVIHDRQGKPYTALRSSERDVIERISQRTPQSRAIGETSGGPWCGPSESQRRA